MITARPEADPVAGPLISSVGCRPRDLDDFASQLIDKPTNQVPDLRVLRLDTDTLFSHDHNFYQLSLRPI